MMQEYILIFSVLIVIETSFILYLCYKVGNDRNKRLGENINRILQDIGHVASLVNTYDKSADTRNNAVKSQLSQISQNLNSAIGQTDKSLTSQLDRVENNVISELHTSYDKLQDSTQQVHTSLNKSFKAKFGDMKTDLLEVQREMREYKDEILRTQAQSFFSMENKMLAIQKDNHSFIQKEFLSRKKELSEMQVFMQSEFQLGKEHLDDTQSSVQVLSSLMNQHLTSLKPLQEMLEHLETLYKKLISLDEEILKQEGSLNGMVEKHVKLVEYTKELSQTSKSIFDLMKLVLIESITKQIPSPQK